MSKQNITIKELAQRLNVSIATVSRALRNTGDVNRDTRERVVRLATELHYSPNYFAQSLVKQQTKIIGVVVPTIYSHYFSQALCGMTDVANENDYYLMFCQSNETAALERKSMEKLLACHVDGLLISISKETKDSSVFEEVLNHGIPIVQFDRILAGLPVTRVIVDEFEGAFKAVEHLIRRGCRRVAHFCGPTELSVSANRLNGYVEALKKHGIAVEKKLIIPCNSFEDDAQIATKKLMRLKTLPDGLFAVNDLSAIAAIQYLKKHGIHVPQDIKVVGFNDDPASRLIDPTLTTVMQPGYEVGKLAIGVLIDEIKNKKNKNRVFKLRTKLISRESSRNPV
ncbi:MAG TPA: LacI family DNA-binding transcriptional regulator [Puia sp.]|jgi:DNA-binding LacI/PurR family transcriptional regulator|nr:LacI family DNA-binding transcriptional regulator [Puia sp.]